MTSRLISSTMATSSLLAGKPLSKCAELGSRHSESRLESKEGFCMISASFAEVEIEQCGDGLQSAPLLRCSNVLQQRTAAVYCSRRPARIISLSSMFWKEPSSSTVVDRSLLCTLLKVRVLFEPIISSEPPNVYLAVARR